MRSFLLVLILASLGGCGLWMPRPDPNQAWVELQTSETTDLRAVSVDDQPLRDHRYFQVTPGTHALGMRYSFQVASSDMGSELPLQRNCKLQLEYRDFNAGSRYRLVAGKHGFRPWAKLLDEHDRLLARAEEKGCGGA